MTNLGNKQSCSSRLEGGIGEEEREYQRCKQKGGTKWVMWHIKHPFSM
jgi:hypothetical protein